MSLPVSSVPDMDLPVIKNSFISSKDEKQREIYYQWQTEIFPPYQGIYFIYNKLDELLYVGKGKNVKKRLDSHCTEFDSHIKLFSEHFYKVETHPVPTGELDNMLYEIYYINKYYPIFNKKDVLYLGRKKNKKRMNDYLKNADTILITRTPAEQTLNGLGFPPEDGHLFNLWSEVQDHLGEAHSYHCSSGMRASINVINQWVAEQKPQFLNNIQNYYSLSSISEVEKQLKHYVRFNEKNIFSTSSSSNPKEGWNTYGVSLYC